MESNFYTTFSSPFDTFTIIWREKRDEILIQRIFLSDLHHKSEDRACEAFQNMRLKSSVSINSLGKKIQEFLNGKAIKFDQDLLDFSICYPVQRKVLNAESKIPSGWVSTYKRIAIQIGIPKGARVVGNALSKNPFPIVIPCHRAIKSNGEIGGFQGGVKMKRKLLELEGIVFSDRGKVLLNKVYY